MYAFNGRGHSATVFDALDLKYSGAIDGHDIAVIEETLEQAKRYLLSSDLPVKEIMYDSGFSNKATFYSLFKKSTGQTPAQFRKSP